MHLTSLVIGDNTITIRIHAIEMTRRDGGHLGFADHAVIIGIATIKAPGRAVGRSFLGMSRELLLAHFAITVSVMAIEHGQRVFNSLVPRQWTLVTAAAMPGPFRCLSFKSEWRRGGFILRHELVSHGTGDHDSKASYGNRSSQKGRVAFHT